MKTTPKNEANQSTGVSNRHSTEPPLKPRPGLFKLTAVVLVLFMAGLLALYFTTVFPNRTLPHAMEIDKLDEPGSPR